MATSVINAFNEFLKEKVNLDYEKTKTARKSKDSLIEQIHKFPDNDSEFPKLYTEIDLHYGSFARRTKIRPLDDIDLMIGLHADGASYNEYLNPTTITVPDSATNLKKLCNDGTNTLNSIKVINKFVKNLENVNQYKKAEKKRNQEAAVLELSSYDWNFDIVPCFFTVKETNGRNYYLIPDGKGQWKKTDPRIARDRAIDINQRHDGNVLESIRILKYWNKRQTMPTASSFMFETLILNYFDKLTSKASSYVDVNLPGLFLYIYSNILNAVNDPAGIQGNMNDLSFDERNKISAKAYEDYKKSCDARQFENDDKMKESINKWREIFGDEFPKYE